MNTTAVTSRDFIRPFDFVGFCDAPNLDLMSRRPNASKLIADRAASLDVVDDTGGAVLPASVCVWVCIDFHNDADSESRLSFRHR